MAAEYRLESSYSLAGSYDDNYRSRADTSNLRDNELHGGRLSSSWDASRRTGLGSTNLSLDINGGYFNDDAFNRVNGKAGLSARRSFSRGTLSADATATLNTVRSAQIENFGGNQFDVLDASRVEGQQANVSGTWVMSQLDTLQATLSAQHQRYESDQFRGYEFGSFSLLYQRVVTEKLTVQLDGSFSELRNDPGDRQIVFSPDVIDGNGNVDDQCPLFFVVAADDGVGNDCFKNVFGSNVQQTTTFRAGLIYKFTEKLDLDLRVGPRETITDSVSEFESIAGAPNQDSVGDIEVEAGKNSSVSFEGTLGYNGEITDATLSARSSETATSSGTLNQTNRFSFGVDRAMSSRWQAGFRLQYIDSERISDSGLVQSGREFLRASIDTSYSLSPGWRISGRFSNERQERGEFDSVVRRNLVSLTLSWRPNAWSIAR